MLIGLYSDQNQSETDEVTEFLVRRSGKVQPMVGYIPASHDPQRKFYESCRTYYNRFGAKFSDYMDLEDGYDEDSICEILKCDIIHLSGGDTLRFQKKLKSRGLFPRLRKYSEEGGILVGVSAGAILLTPSVETTLICENRDYSNHNDFEGLGLVPVLFDPHNDGREGRDDRCIKYSLKYSLPLFSVTDSQVLVFDGNRIRVYGGAEIYNDGQPVAGGDAAR
jgi:dipeptidase E